MSEDIAEIEKVFSLTVFDLNEQKIVKNCGKNVLRILRAYHVVYPVKVDVACP